MIKTYFKCEVSYLKAVELSNEEKLVSEQYVVEATNYGDAETQIHKIMEAILGNKTFTVKKVEKFRLHNILNKEAGEAFWVAKSQYIADEKKVVETILVSAEDLDEVVAAMNALHGTYDKMLDVKTIAINKSKVLEVFDKDTSIEAVAAHYAQLREQQENEKQDNEVTFEEEMEPVTF